MRLPTLNHIVLLIAVFASSSLSGCSKAGIQADADLNFTPSRAPQPKARPSEDAFTQIEQLGRDQQAARRNGGYAGQQIAETAAEDPAAAETMLATLKPLITRAHKALALPSEPYIYDPKNEDYPMLSHLGGSAPQDVAPILRADEVVNLAKGRLAEANQDIEDIFRLANLISLMPSTYALQHEKPIQMMALHPVKQFVKLYHDQPKARAELKEIMERKRKTIPVVDRIRNDAFFTVQRTRENKFNMNAAWIEPLSQGQMQGYGIIASLAKPCGDDYNAFQAKLIDYLKTKYDLKAQVKPDPTNVDQNVRGTIQQFLSLSNIGNMNQMDGAARHDLILAWLNVEAYRDTHGRFPDTLEEAGFAGFKDPYSHGQEPYHYKTDGKTMKVWSIGSDWKDNGGVEPARGFGPGDIVISIGG